MKKTLILLLILVFTFNIIGCTSNKIDDRRIIGTWISDSTGARCVFKENGTAELYTSDNKRNYYTKDGLIILDYGRFGTDSLSYSFSYGATADGQIAEYLILNGNYFRKTSN